MNGRRFRKWVKIVIALYGATIVIGVLLKVFFPGKDDPIYNGFKDLIPFAVAIPAAWLGYCFQRRQAFLKDTRELWTKLVGAVQEALQYTHATTALQSDYGRVLKGLSTAIDELRAVFSNFGEAEAQIGLFPFESLKRIFSLVSSLGFGWTTEQPDTTVSADPTTVDAEPQSTDRAVILEQTMGSPGASAVAAASKAKSVRKQILAEWKNLRKHFLTELERGEPGQANTPYIHYQED